MEFYLVINHMCGKEVAFFFFKGEWFCLRCFSGRASILISLRFLPFPSTEVIITRGDFRPCRVEEMRLRY